MRKIIVSVLLLSLLAVACSLGGEATTEPPSSPPSETQEATTGGSEGTEAPPTEAPTEITVHGSGGECTLNAEFVADITVPDNTLVQPGTAFRKTWRLRNNGTCAWPGGTKLVFVSGEAMGAPPSVLAPAAEAGAEAEVSVDFVAPTAPGTYKSTWQLESPDGTRFGSLFYTQIVVPAPTSEASPPPPTAAPTQAPTPSGCSIAVDGALAPLASAAAADGMNLGCPRQPAAEVYSAIQEYWANVGDPNPHMHYRSLMIWRSDTKKIYVITIVETGPDIYTIYNDTWAESMPEEPPACSNLTIPQGYILPIRGFGKVWCDHQLYNTIGWPKEHEVGMTFLVQPMEHGVLMRVKSGFATPYAIALEAGTSHALVLQSP